MQNSANSMFRIPNYNQPEPIQENFKEAREYYKKAINLGNEPAKELLKNLENDKQF